jgi:type VI secretion system protein ImpK
MHTALYLKSPILEGFRLFYRELLLLQDLALEHSIPKEETKTADKILDSLQEQTTAHRIRRRLEDMLMSQYTEKGGNYTAPYYREAQYIMVALADEIFINLKWRGNEEWKDNLLESLIYNTQDAGDKFFENLDHFLEADHSKGIDMASLYLIALGLGFKGRYRGSKNEKELFAYRQKLYRYIASDDVELMDNRSHLFPQVYENIIADRQNAMMPDSRPWWLALGVIFLGFISLSSLIWLTHMNNFSPLVSMLEKWSGFK